MGLKSQLIFFILVEMFVSFSKSYLLAYTLKIIFLSRQQAVQRVDDNPNIVQVSYRDEHICHKSLKTHCKLTLDFWFSSLQIDKTSKN